MFFFWSLAANELLKAVQTIPPQNTHCPFLKKKTKKKEKHLFYYFFRCAEKDKFEKVSSFFLLIFSAFSSYQLLLFRTLCVCVCVSVVKITQTKKMQVVVVFRLSAGRNSGRTDSCLKQLKNIFFFFFFLFFSESSQQTNNNKTVLFHLVQSAHLWRSRHKTAAHRR